MKSKSNHIQAYKPFADPVPPNIKQYQLILTKYQPVSSYTDPVPSSTTYYSSFDESRTVYLVYTTSFLNKALESEMVEEEEGDRGNCPICVEAIQVGDQVLVVSPASLFSLQLSL